MIDQLPPSLTWNVYVNQWADDRGGWSALANELIDRAANTDVPQDAQSVERGLRRLATREHKPGGQYGRWMLRYFGFIAAVDELVKWMGQYHTRFADLPCNFRLEHLTLWNRPPIAESRLAVWIQLGIAHAHRSKRAFDQARHWQGLARRSAPHAGRDAEIECLLLDAQLLSDADTHATADVLDAIAARLEGDPVFVAMLADLRAHALIRPSGGNDRAAVLAAQAAYSEIPDSAEPFVAFRKAVGLGYCAWKLGDRAAAETFARAAVEHAGDGGLLRMRVNALNLLTRVQDGAAARASHDRAARIAARLEDEELMTRVANVIVPE
ncbi:MAG: hypothetical protein QM831_26340 [Kofleriaceae bacterium]